MLFMNIDLVKLAKIMIIAAFVWLAIEAISFKFLYQDFFSCWLKVQDAGAVSDFFSGAITPFFTLAAFFLLLESYNLQKEELQLTRDEMQKSADALKNQYEIMKSEKKQQIVKGSLIFL